MQAANAVYAEWVQTMAVTAPAMKIDPVPEVSWPLEVYLDP
jgi:hypothetical protein